MVSLIITNVVYIVAVVVLSVLVKQTAQSHKETSLSYFCEAVYENKETIIKAAIAVIIVSDVVFGGTMFFQNLHDTLQGIKGV